MHETTIAIVVGTVTIFILAIPLWLFSERMFEKHLPCKTSDTANAYRKARIWTGICLVAVCLFIVGLLWRPALMIIGGLTLLIGIQILMAHIYRIKTGKDTHGMRFWRQFGGS